MKRTLLPVLVALLASPLAAAQEPITGPQLLTTLDSLCKSGSETTGAASYNGLELISGFVDFRTDGTIKNAFAVSSDGGISWSHLVVRPPVALQDSVEADPMTAYDARTNTLFAGGISRAKCIYVARKLSGQNGFEPSKICRLSSWPDKGWMAAGPRPGLPNTTRLYITFNEGAIWSDNLGDTWTEPISLGLGAGFLPRIGPQGQLYVCYYDGYWGVKFTKSLDGGLTWSPAIEAATRLAAWGVTNYGIPGTFRNYPNSTMAVNPINGNIAIVYFDQTNVVGGQKNLDLYVVRSSDQGATWCAPERLNHRPLSQISDMIFPWAEFTSDGRLHLFAMDTSFHPGQADGAPHGLWDQVYMYSDDSGANWSNLIRLTPSSWDSFFEGSGVPFLGDYQGMAVARKSVFPVYPDTHSGQAKVYVNRIYNPIEEPSSFAILFGIHVSGSIDTLFRNDGATMVVRANQLSRTSPAIQIETSAQNLPLTLNATLKIQARSSVTVGSVEQRIEAFNVMTQSWDTIDVRPATLSPTTTTASVSNPSSYASMGTMRWRLSLTPLSSANSRTWVASLDQDVLLISP